MEAWDQSITMELALSVLEPKLVKTLKCLSISAINQSSIIMEG